MYFQESMVNKNKYVVIRQFARENRKNQTQAESVFWSKVRRKQFYGIKFNRQYIISYSLFGVTNYFIADFYCHSRKLIVELDGRIHKYQQEYDQYREEILNGLELQVLRFNNEQVINEWKYVEARMADFIIKPKE